MRLLSPQCGLHLRQVFFGVGDDEDFDDVGHRHLAAAEMDAFLAALRRLHVTDGLGRRLNFAVQPRQEFVRRPGCAMLDCGEAFRGVEGAPEAGRLGCRDQRAAMAQPVRDHLDGVPQGLHGRPLAFAGGGA